MKSFLRKFGLFILPFLGGICVLFLTPYDPGFGFYQIENHCRNGHWLYHQIYHSPHNIDIAFLGTSRTMCALNDGRLEQQLNKQTATDTRIANMGFARPGRTFQYALAKHLLQQHKPELLVLEVRTFEDRFSHMDFPYIAETEDVLLADLLVNQRYVSDVFTAGKLRFLYWKERLLREQRNIDSADVNRSHSFIEVGSVRYSDSSYLRPIPHREIPKMDGKHGSMLSTIVSPNPMSGPLQLSVRMQG